MSEEKKLVGEVRPSQLLYTYGIGSIIDLPDFSVLVMGLDDWPAGDSDAMRAVSEDRLLAAVRKYPRMGQVSRFLAPPIDPNSSNPWDPQADMAPAGVPVATFPRWMVCPACRLLTSIDAGLIKLKTERWRAAPRYVHENCSKAKAPMAVPARFLIACEDGHLDDFPWVEFVHGAGGPCEAPILRLLEYGPSGEARDLVVRCEACQRERRLAEAFGRQNRQNLPACRGRHPHLREYDPNGCERQVQPLVLGASNLWFPLVLSSIAIPGGTERLDQLVGEQWATLQNVTSLEVLVAFRSAAMLGAFARYTNDELWKAIQRRKEPAPADDNVEDLRLPEWQVFTATQAVPNTPDFRLRGVTPPPAFAGAISRVVLVERMREVKVLTGFTRIDSPGEGLDIDAEDEIRTIAPLSRRAPTWLPAVEVRGEGIFLQFSEEQIAEWLGRPAVRERGRAFGDAHRRWYRARDVDPAKVNDPGMRYVLLHSFSHALMRQMALESGYAAASISERIYARNPDEPGGPMAGILLYTAASDSEGTLGGLVRLGETTILERTIAGALESMTLCASDPTCAEHEPSNDGMSLHAAACHACLFAPETSCERGNRYLDRSVLVGTFTQADLALFAVTA